MTDRRTSRSRSSRRDRDSGRDRDKYRENDRDKSRDRSHREHERSRDTERYRGDIRNKHSHTRDKDDGKDARYDRDSGKSSRDRDTDKYHDEANKDKSSERRGHDSRRDRTNDNRRTGYTDRDRERGRDRENQGKERDVVRNKNTSGSRNDSNDRDREVDSANNIKEQENRHSYGGSRDMKSKVERTRERDRQEEEQARTMQYGKPSNDQAHDGEDTEEISIDKEKPNFELSGMLAKETNTVDGVELKYAEPVEARKPKLHWRLYPYKGTTELPILHIHRQSAYLLGRDRKVVDIPIDHPSCSNQHAVIQYRLVTSSADDGRVKRNIKPYLIDLDSGNGTFINKVKIKARRYHELKVGDSVSFALSSREYVIMYAEMKADEV